MRYSIYSVEILYEQDVVLARKRCREITALLGFDHQDQVRITTALSELCRNAYQYAGGGKVRFYFKPVSETGPGQLEIEVQDKGPGIAHLEEVMGGSYQSPTGMGLGLLGARRLMETFDVATGKAGTSVRASRTLPAHSPLRTPSDLAELSAKITPQEPGSAFDELRHQNQELLSALDHIKAREAELAEVNSRLEATNQILANTNQELEETNRGVVALYAELDEKAEALRKANDLKTRFLSNMTHEFRTPLNSMLGISRILLDRLDGPLTSEQERQAKYIYKAAGDMLVLVNDMLDLAKVEAGKTPVRIEAFELADLFGALKGMMRPLIPEGGGVALIFEDVLDLPKLRTDEGKISQVLRNLISNALKFTEQGEVRISARMVSTGLLELRVSDTGIGISPEDQARIFREYGQLSSVLHAKVKGSGLGLSLSRSLVELLGGRLELESELGRGSVFTATVPVVIERPAGEEEREIGRPMMFFAGNPESIPFFSSLAESLGYDLKQILDPSELLDQMRFWRPAAILLDGEMRNLPGFLASGPRLPTALVGPTSLRDLPAGVPLFPRSEEAIASWLKNLHRWCSRSKVLLIDDDENSRYLISSLLRGYRFSLTECSSGEEGLVAAREKCPDLIFLDYSMPGMNGDEVLRELKADPRTSKIPVVIHTSKVLNREDKVELLRNAIAILPKENLSRTDALREVDWILEKASAGASARIGKDEQGIHV